MSVSARFAESTSPPWVSLFGPDGLRHVPTQFLRQSVSYEIGGKNAFLNHRLQIDSSLFWTN